MLSPLILITAVLCSLASGGAEHNNATVKACFYGPNYTEKVPSEFKTHVSEMREAFSLLDSAIAATNSSEDSAGSLDPTMVKAVFFALCFGEDAPTARAAGRFVDCFYSEQELTREVESEDENGETVTETETYMTITPLSLSDAYINLSAELGREITDEDKDNIRHIYTMRPRSRTRLKATSARTAARPCRRLTVTATAQFQIFRLACTSLLKPASPKWSRRLPHLSSSLCP